MSVDFGGVGDSNISYGLNFCAYFFDVFVKLLEAIPNFSAQVSNVRPEDFDRNELLIVITHHSTATFLLFRRP